MKLFRLLTIAAASFALLVAGCSSQKGAKKGDDTKTQTQAQTKDESDEDSEESEEESEEKAEEGDEHPGEEHPGKSKGKGKKKGHKKGKEHPGKEHPGEGKKKGKEHPGDEHPGDDKEEDDEDEDDDESSKSNFTADDIKTSMREHIDKNSSTNGVFTIKDEKTGETLELKFVKIHDPVREMTEKGSYFGCTDFHVKGNEDKIYDLDFWLKPKGDSLEVVRSKVHKHPTKKNGKWVKEARYTFKNNEVAKIE